MTMPANDLAGGVTKRVTEPISRSGDGDDTRARDREHPRRHFFTAFFADFLAGALFAVFFADFLAAFLAAAFFVAVFTKVGSTAARTFSTSTPSIFATVSSPSSEVLPAWFFRSMSYSWTVSSFASSNAHCVCLRQRDKFGLALLLARPSKSILCPSQRLSQNLMLRVVDSRERE